MENAGACKTLSLEAVRGIWRRGGDIIAAAKRCLETAENQMAYKSLLTVENVRFLRTSTS